MLVSPLVHCLRLETMKVAAPRKRIAVMAPSATGSGLSSRENELTGSGGEATTGTARDAATVNCGRIAGDGVIVVRKLGVGERVSKPGFWATSAAFGGKSSWALL